MAIKKKKPMGPNEWAIIAPSQIILFCICIKWTYSCYWQFYCVGILELFIAKPNEIHDDYPNIFAAINQHWFSTVFSLVPL